MVSLLVGAGSGGIVLLLEYIYSQSGSSIVAMSQTALTLVLAVAMYIRYQASGKFMPAGLVLSLSVAILLVYGQRVLAAATSKPHKH